MKKKIQVTVDLTMLDWYKKQAEIYGVSVSGLVNIAMAEYRINKDVVNNMPQIVDMMSNANSLKEGLPQIKEMLSAFKAEESKNKL